MIFKLQNDKNKHVFVSGDLFKKLNVSGYQVDSGGLE